MTITHRLFWTTEEYVKIFKNILKHYPNPATLPATTQKKIWENIISVLPEGRRRAMHHPTVKLIKAAFAGWLADLPETEWTALAKESKKVQNIVVTDLIPPKPVVVVEAKRSLSIVGTGSLEDLPSKSPKAVPAQKPFPFNDTVLPEPVAEPPTLLMKIDGLLVTRLAPLVTMLQSIQAASIPLVSTEDSDKLTRLGGFFDKPALSKEDIGDVFNNIFVKPLTKNEEISPSSLADKEIIAEARAEEISMWEEAYKKAQATPVKVFTEQDIRNIVREEIEKIFGSIHPATDAKAVVEKTVSVVDQKGIGLRSGSETLLSMPRKEAVQPTKDLVVPTKIYKFFVYGLTSAQFSRICKEAPANVRLQGSPTYNQSSKGQAKTSDAIIVSKFSTHSVYDSLRSICDPKRVFFVSGGMTMLSEKIKELAAMENIV